MSEAKQQRGHTERQRRDLDRQRLFNSRPLALFTAYMFSQVDFFFFSPLRIALFGAMDGLLLRNIFRM